MNTIIQARQSIPEPSLEWTSMPLGADMSNWVVYVVCLFASLYVSVMIFSSVAVVFSFGVIRAEGGVSDIFLRGERSRLVDIVMVLPSPNVST
jgi:hypothetical protein